MVKDCEKLEEKTETDAQKGKPTQKKVYPECGACGNKIHHEERGWQGADALLKPKLNRPEDSSDNSPDFRSTKTAI